MLSERNESRAYGERRERLISNLDLNGERRRGSCRAMLLVGSRGNKHRNPEAIVSPFFLVNICRKVRFISHKSFETIIS